MEIQFTSEDFQALAKNYPESWMFINNLRLLRENQELQKKLHAAGPQSSVPEETA